MGPRRLGPPGRGTAWQRRQDGRVTDLLVRPMAADDVAGVERLTGAAFVDLDRRVHRAGWPEPRARDEAGVRRVRRQCEHALAHDARGCWVAEDAAGLLGVAVALRRDLTWVLATFAVRPGDQRRGVGSRLMEAAAAHGTGCLRGILSASEDAAAVRLYRRAGFVLHPTMQLSGRVPRSVLPVVERVREGTPADLDLADSVDRRTRDAAHGPDHRVLAATYRLVVMDRASGSGYAYVHPAGGPVLLAATDRRTATALMWECLAASDPGRDCVVSHVTAENQWALDVGLEARLSVHAHEYLAVRRMRPPAPYLPHGFFL
jgi:ribosomal protein S18 acetylase RimI-like enzyme